MIDLKNLEHYRENNRIEAKKALGGLPQSIWETYSAFANTLGGVILLGVEEYGDKSLHAVDLPDPKRLMKLFWDAVNNPQKASVNLLSSKDVRIEKVNGKHILVINVPRAERFYKPVYIDGNPLNTYRRNGEGDYKVTREEYQAMVRDASVRSQDMIVLKEMKSDVFNSESVRSYRQRMKITHPGHVWENLDNDEFLLKIGASAIGEDGKKHPTGAGLLMFGNEYDIVREFPYYFLDYRDERFDGYRWTDRITSSSGDWSGNVLDFYFRVYNKIQQGLKVPFAIKNGVRVDDTPVHIAIREALANCIANADYYGTRGLVVTKSDGFIQIANPGSFRIEVDAAKSGGISDPRNGVILKMFNLINIGERAGSGIPNIYRVWREQNWQEPVILQLSEPDRTLFILPLSPAEVASSSICEGSAVSQYGIGEKEGGSLYKIGENDGDSSFFDGNLNKIGENKGVMSSEIGEKEGESSNSNVVSTILGKKFNEIGENERGVSNKIGEKEGGASKVVSKGGESAKKQIKRRMIIDYLTEHSEASANELAEWVHLKPSRARDYLRELVRDGIVIAQGETRSRVYRLKY